MNVHMKLTQYDEDHPEGVVLVETEGTYENHLLFYQESPSIHHEISFFEDGMEIKRYADVHSITTLKKGELGTSMVESPYGQIEMQSKLHQYSLEENRCEVEYELFQETESILRQRLVWDWEG